VHAAVYAANAPPPPLPNRHRPHSRFFFPATLTVGQICRSNF
jgi:hypothetical protein